MHAEDNDTTLVFVLRQFSSRGEAKHWPLALGWVSEDDRRTKQLHVGALVSSAARGVPGLRLSCYKRSDGAIFTRLHVLGEVPPFQVPQRPALGQAKYKNS